MSEPIDLVWPQSARDLDDDAIAALYSVDRPWCRVNFVSSLDGAATRSGVSGGLSSTADKRVFDLLRRLTDVVMVGAGTVRTEGYGPMRVDAASAAWREANGMPQHPVFAIVSGSLNLDPQSNIFTDAPVRPIVITTSAPPASLVARFEAVADVIVAGAHHVDPTLALAALRERGLTHILCEGGPTLFGSMLDADAVDELCLTVSPTLEAGDAPRIANGPVPEPRGMQLNHVLAASGTLILSYHRAR